MSDLKDFYPDDEWILSRRGPKKPVNPRRPYAFLTEKERTNAGIPEDVSVIFLTNRECPFHCLMCDLWKNTTEDPLPPGAISDQIEWALSNMPRSRHLKLYNSGSFFDPKAVAHAEYERIASLLKGFDTVIVETHPDFINKRCLEFRDLIKADLQIAIGLEIADQDMLKRLNKRMTLAHFRHAVSSLKTIGISVRAFILLKPPFVTEDEGVMHACRTLDFAFGSGAECCVIIPVRAGNGAMEELMEKGYFSPPLLSSLEQVLEYGISLNAGRVFADTWDLQSFSRCNRCFDARRNRITEMNFSQKIITPVQCYCS